MKQNMDGRESTLWRSLGTLERVPSPLTCSTAKRCRVVFASTEADWLLVELRTGCYLYLYIIVAHINPISQSSRGCG